MKILSLASTVVFALVVSEPFLATGNIDDDFCSTFHGKDLTGWVNVNCASSTFVVKDGEIIATGKPAGYLRTEKQYENFIAEFDWMHVNKKQAGNSGLFVWADPLPAVGIPYPRTIEVPVLVNQEKPGWYTSQGDLFSIGGAHCVPDRPHPHGWERCLPSEKRSKGGGEWNHYKVIGNNSVLKLHVNGKVVSGLSKCQPRKGYLALKSAGAECHFKNLKIQELPSTNPTPEEIAHVTQGFRNLYTGLDLSGWKVQQIGRWQPRDLWEAGGWVLHYKNKGGALWTEMKYDDAQFLFDFRFDKENSLTFDISFRYRQGEEAQGLWMFLAKDGTFSLLNYADLGNPLMRGKLHGLRPPGQWNRLQCSVVGDAVEVKLNSAKDVKTARAGGLPKTGLFMLHPIGEMDFCNLFVRELKE